MSELLRFDSVSRWCSRLRPSTAETNLYVLRGFLGWLGECGGPLVGLSPDELVDYQIRNRNYDVLDWVQKYFLSEAAKGWRLSYKRRSYAAIRSFFMHNRADLPKDPGFRLMSDVPKVVGDLSVDEFKRILDSCNPMYRAIYLCMFQGALGIGEFEYWNQRGYDKTMDQIEREINYIRIDLPGRKMKRNVTPYYTFIGRDAINALKQHLDKKGKNEWLFVNQYGNPVMARNVQIYWMRHIEALGLIKKKKNGYTGNRYGKNIHELRDLFRTRWQKSGRAAEAGEFFMGHDIDSLGYNKAMNDENYTRMEYRKAEKWLNILSEDPEHIHVNEIESKFDELLKAKAPGYEEILRRLEALEKTGE